jgi:alpha,alpha-trehalase
VAWWLRFAALVGCCLPAFGQANDINSYIHGSWDKLQRSMSDCASIIDPKIPTIPVLYLPADSSFPTSVRSMQSHCHVDVRRLPRPIHHEGDIRPNELPSQGLLYLPHPYVVPGGRFNEMYGWDSYFIILGELADGRLELARGTVENFFFEIRNYGAILNANRTYYLTRSQPPFLSSMVLAVYDAIRTTDRAAARQWLQEAEPYLIQDHTLWVSPPHLAGDTGLSRYDDLGHGPVPEMNDASTYYIDIIHWLLSHPSPLNGIYLRKLVRGQLSSCSHALCLRTSFDGYALTEAFFSGDRAMRESGFDTSFRFGPFSGSTEDYAPVCLNSLLFKYERDLATIETILGNNNATVGWNHTANIRQAKMRELMVNPTNNLYFDYDFVTKERSNYEFLTSYYALWAGLASPEESKAMVSSLSLFERPGGLRMSTEYTGGQWDAPFGWAPTNWLTVAGLAQYGYVADADRIARKFMMTVKSNFERDGTIREKYNMDTSSVDVTISTGYKENVIGFGWTNGVYLEMQRLVTTSEKHDHKN